MSIENSHLPQAPDFPPKGPTDPEVTTEGAGDSVPDTAYEFFGGVPGDAQASAANFKYPSSSGPEAAWTQEQIDAYDPTVKIDPNDTTFAQRLTEQSAATQTEQGVQPDKKSKKGLFAIGAGVTTLLVAGAAFFGANAAKDSGKNETLPPEPTPTASAPVMPGVKESPTPVATETAPAVSIYELKAGQTPEALAKDYQALTTTWVNASCTPETPTKFLDQNGVTPEQYSLQLATEEGHIRAIALLGPDYESYPELKKYADNMINLNAQVLNLYIRTAVGGGPGYEQTYTFDSLTSSTVEGATTTLSFEGHVNNNGSAFPNVVQPGPSSQKISYSLTFTKSGATEKLTKSTASDPR